MQAESKSYSSIQSRLVCLISVCLMSVADVDVDMSNRSWVSHGVEGNDAQQVQRAGIEPHQHG